MLNEKNRYKNILTDLIYLAVVAVIVYICYKLFYLMIINLNGDYKSDIPYYIKRANDGQNSMFRLPFVLFRSLYNITDSELPINIFLAVQIALIFFANHVYIRYFSACEIKNTGYRIAVHFLSIAAVFAGPIYVPRIHRAFYRNTFPIFAWHSPTQQTMTLFVILGTVCLFKMLDNYEEKVSPKWWTGTAVLYLLSAYSKPSFIIDLAPAIVIAFIIELFVNNGLPFWEKFRKLFIMGCSLIPSGVYMIVLNYLIYQRADRAGDSEILIDSSKFTEYNHLWVAICCCMAFPLVVMLFNWKKIFKDRRYRLIILIAIMGLLQWGLLGESGRRSSHGNFGWGRIIGGYMLMLTSMSIAVGNIRDKEFLGDRKWLRALYFLMLAGSLALHLLSHCYYFYTMYHGYGFWR